MDADNYPTETSHPVKDTDPEGRGIGFNIPRQCGSDVSERFTLGEKDCFLVVWSAPNDSVTRHFTDPRQKP